MSLTTDDAPPRIPRAAFITSLAAVGRNPPCSPVGKILIRMLASLAASVHDGAHGSHHPLPPTEPNTQSGLSVPLEYLVGEGCGGWGESGARTADDDG